MAESECTDVVLPAGGVRELAGIFGLISGGSLQEGGGLVLRGRSSPMFCDSAPLLEELREVWPGVEIPPAAENVRGMLRADLGQATGARDIVPFLSRASLVSSCRRPRS